MSQALAYDFDHQARPTQAAPTVVTARALRRGYGKGDTRSLTPGHVPSRA
ncbi:MAG: hypothetical protein ACM3QU_15390 [Verrucomicrobiota bacterium]